MDDSMNAVDRTFMALSARIGDEETAQGDVQHMQGGFLIALSPSLSHREYALSFKPATIGRDAQHCDVVCVGDTISRKHCVLITEDGSAYRLQDLHSTNGVYVNQRRVNGETALTDGDLIGLGSEHVVHLRFQRESGRNRPWTISLPKKDAWAIGRSPACDVSLAFESTVSSRHALVRPRGGQIEVADLGSVNGTWLNGRRVKRAILEPTDSIMIGSTLLRFSLEEDGALRAIRRDCGDEIALECVGLTRDVAGGRRILDRISLAIRPGEFVGLLGPSGAGKSTLLQSLNGYHPAAYGCVLLNEMPLYPCFDMFRNTIGYVPQDDIVYPELTVEDSLDYVARLRLPPDMSAGQRRDLIQTTLETLGLTHVRTSRVQELSGGQRKRVSIGCELITRPSLLFLDEPTSGMDPSTEERLMRHFQSMAQHGTTVLITTHILYNLGLLDRVVILARGRLVFFGTPQEAMGFFTIGGQPVERPTQIFELLEGEHIHTRTNDQASAGDAKEAVAEEYAQKYRESDLYKKHVGGEFSGIARELQEISAQSGGKTTSPRPGEPSQRAAYRTLLDKPTAGARKSITLNWFSPRALWTLTRRNMDIKFVPLRRALFYFAVPIVLALATLSLRTSSFPDDAEATQQRSEIRSLLTYTMPGGMGSIPLGEPIKRLLAPDGAKDPRPAEDVVFALKHEGLPNLPTPISVLLMFVMTAVFMGTLMSCLDLSTERPIYIRERMANQKIADYIGSKLPFLLLITAAQCLLFLMLCRLKPGLRYFDFPATALAMVAMAWTSCAMGLFLSAIDPSPGRFSVILAIVAVLPQLVLSGGLGPDFYGGMPKALRLVADAFPARWGLEMLMTSFYYHPSRTALAWIQDFTPNSIGFRFGPQVYWNGTAVLFLQGVWWLVLCGMALKRLDRAR